MIFYVNTNRGPEQMELILAQAYSWGQQFSDSHMWPKKGEGFKQRVNEEGERERERRERERSFIGNQEVTEGR
jgi:hypothetical protein